MGTEVRRNSSLIERQDVGSVREESLSLTSTLELKVRLAHTRVAYRGLVIRVGT